MPERLIKDPRTAWAYRQYSQRAGSRGLTEGLASSLLAMLEPDEHAEFIGDVGVPETQQELEAIQLVHTSAHVYVAVRTIAYWALLRRESCQILAPLRQGQQMWNSDHVTGPDVGWATDATDPAGEEVSFKVFCEPHSAERFVLISGAGGQIKRLPDSPLALPPPDLASLPEHVERERATALVTEWRTAEDVACAHMRRVGFTDARLSGGGRDGGLDVISRLGVAQVKMQALPVSAPLIQQLRGAAPLARHHVFYSTSGYTAAAVATAEEVSVALYKVDTDGAVVAANPMGLILARRGPVESSAQDLEAVPITATQAAEDYAERVTARVSAALKEMDWVDGTASTDAQARASGYATQALQNLRSRPELDTPQAVVAFYRHTELLAITWFRALGLSYPDGATRSPSRAEDSLEAYYDV